MILFELRCAHDHHFEGWFKDNATYDAQAAAGEIACPICGDTHVGKAIMAPRLNKATGQSLDAQGAALVAGAIADGSIWQGQAWQEIVAGAKAGRGVLHFIGLFSDGNVHSHIDHLKAMVVQAKAEGVKTVRIHALLDGRDVPETSALEYVEPFEAFLAEISDPSFDARIASGGGRQVITMDRYEANWALVEAGWKTHVLGQGEQFASTAEAVKALRQRHPGTIDQDLPPFVIGANGQPVGTIEDGDAVVFYNFRGDRAIEITRAFEEADFDKFDRIRTPKVTYAGMLQYDGDLQLPKRFLVAPPASRTPPASGSAARVWPSLPARRPRSSATSPTSGTATAPASSRARPTRKCPATWCPSSSGPG